MRNAPRRVPPTFGTWARWSPPPPVPDRKHLLFSLEQQVLFNYNEKRKENPMEKFIPYEKLSKKEQRKRDAQRRGS